MAKSLRERQRELRENLILDVAYELLLEQGYQKMNMDDLAARVGIAKMTLYQHFSSKEALAVGVIVRGMRIIEEELEPFFASERPALERLREIFARSLEQRAAIRRVNVELALATVLQNPAYQAQYGRISEQWAQLIDQAKAEGAVDESLSTPVLVRMLLHAFQANYDDLIKENQVSVEELSHTLVSVVINGMRASRSSF